MDVRRMTAVQAREIMARVLARHNVAKHLGSLVNEHETLTADGNEDQAESVRRTIDELAGHWHDGERIGAAEIMRASALTRAHGASDA